MNHQLIKTIIYDRHEIIRRAEILPRNFVYEESANYVLTGLRRAGKTTQLYTMVRELVESGIDWEQIIFINFEDERLADFRLSDFQDIVLVQSELSEKRGYYFFDEIQNINGWEQFARRMADSGEHVYITGSNARMLSSDIESRLGGRYMTKYIYPYTFQEYLNAMNVPFDERALLGTRSVGRIRRSYEDYFRYGALPEILHFKDKRSYLENIYQKIQLGDVIARNNIRNANAMRILIKKIAETVRSDVSYTRLHSCVNAVGMKISKEIIINYVSYVEEAYLIFRLRNYVSKFAERESNPKYYFSDNGILNLFLIDRDTALLENQIAIRLHQKYGEQVYFFKSSSTGIDVDFYIPEEGLAIQVTYSLSDSSFQREMASLISLAHSDRTIRNLKVVTFEEANSLEISGVKIEVIPAYQFLLDS